MTKKTLFFSIIYYLLQSSSNYFKRTSHTLIKERNQTWLIVGTKCRNNTKQNPTKKKKNCYFTILYRDCIVLSCETPFRTKYTDSDKVFKERNRNSRRTVSDRRLLFFFMGKGLFFFHTLFPNTIYHL